MATLLKLLFFALMVKPLALVVLGLNIRHLSNLPKTGPAVLAANHNSHLDALVLMSLYSFADLKRVRPVGAADYFMSNKVMAWFSLNILGLIPLERQASARDLDKTLAPCVEALERGEILILFPEGSRGKAEQISKIKKGLFYLAEKVENTAIIPVVMRGLGKALPRGEALFVPYNCDVVIGEPLNQLTSSKDFVETLGNQYQLLLDQCLTKVE